MNSFCKSTLGALTLLLLGAGGAAWGHAPDRHDEGHMALMEKQRQRVSEEYRIMDRTPVSPTMPSLRRGKELFLTYCAPCHGAEGEGDGPAAAALKAPPASFRNLEHSDVFGPGEKYWIIRDGFPDAGMPPFAPRIAPIDRWHLVNYIHFLQKPARRQSHGGGHSH